MAAVPPVNFEVIDAMETCGVNNVQQFNGATAAQRIAMEIFDDDHHSVMDKSYTELQEDLKAFFISHNSKWPNTPYARNHEEYTSLYAMGKRSH
jgi:uncharacterized iron-regulated protein